MKKILNNLLTENEQQVLFFILLFAFLGMLIHATHLTASADPEAVDSLLAQSETVIKFDLLTVTDSELTQIPGIGEKRAADIISYRETNGFSSLRDLMKIKGIGEVSYQKIEGWFYAFGDDNSGKIPKDKLSKKNTSIDPIDINKATLDELCTLKGIGPGKAQKIIDLRTELGRFSNVDQLLEVKGIGEKTLSKLREYVFAGD